MAIDPVTAGLTFGNAIIERLWPNPREAEKAKVELAKLSADGELQHMLETSKLTLAEIEQQTSIALAQVNVNEIEAASDSKFKSYWRPFIGWTCGGAFAWYFLCGPVLVSVLSIFGIDVTLTDFATGELMTVLIGMLGLGGYRTYERVSGKIPPGV
jgi:hypothetical protein